MTLSVSREAVRDILRKTGPLPSADIREFFPDDLEREVAGVISALRKAKTKQVYIERWERTVVNTRLRLRAVYALGDKPDARKPPNLSNRQRCQRWRARQVRPSAPNSVWQLGAFL